MIGLDVLQAVLGAAAVFTLLWILLYERRRSKEPNRTERFLARGWLLFRRIACFATAAFFTFVAIGVVFAPADAPLEVQLGSILLCLFIAATAVWIGMYGGGRLKSMSDDRKIHQHRKKRYGWRR